MSQQITYGSYLTPFDPPTPSQASRDPLAHDPALLSILTLSALVPQRTPREILWHLRCVSLASRDIRADLARTAARSAEGFLETKSS